MPTSVRLDPLTEALLARLTRQRGATRSQIVREAVAAYGAAEAAAANAAPTLFDKIGHLVGGFPGPDTDLSVDSGRKVSEMLRARHEEEQRAARRPPAASGARSKGRSR